MLAAKKLEAAATPPKARSAAAPEKMPLPDEEKIKAEHEKAIKAEHDMAMEEEKQRGAKAEEEKKKAELAAAAAAEKAAAEKAAAEKAAAEKAAAEKAAAAAVEPAEPASEWDKEDAAADEMNENDAVDDELGEDEEEDDEEEVKEKKVKGKSGKESAAIEPDPRPHLNVVFIGHVDAGKSTTCGNVLYLTGYVDERTIEKYQREAKEKNRESWFLAYVMDTSDEEKAKGKTVEVGRAQFELAKKRFTILDAPGHKSYVPNMISGASQADIGVLIVSARKGEFETGFEKGGQTREHALLAKTLGVEKLIVAINKMDDPSVDWEKERYDEIVDKIKPFLKQSGFKDDDTVCFLPMSGLSGANIQMKKDTAAWYEGPTLFEILDNTDTSERDSSQPLRMPMLDGYRDMGAMTATGKLEQGCVRPGTKCTIVPTGKPCLITKVFINDVEVTHANVGETVTLSVNGVNEQDLCKGFVLSSIIEPCRAERKFKASLQIVELLEDRPVLTSGFKCIMHCHTAIEEVEITKLYELRYISNMKKAEKNPVFARSNSVLSCLITTNRLTAVDSFMGCSKLGRFTLRDEGVTIAIGRITELPKPK